VASARVEDGGVYDVVVTGSCGSATSDPARVRVVAVPPIVIDEVRVASSSDDPDRYFELAGEPGRALDGLTYVVVDASGIVEAAIPLDGQMMPSDGHFLAAAAGSSLACTASAELLLPPQMLPLADDRDATHLLVVGFGGAVGDDLDVDDDCALDVEPWVVVLDRLSLDLAAGGSCSADATARHAMRCPDVIGGWQSDATPPACSGGETPGAANPPCILVGPRGLVVCEGQTAQLAVEAAGVPPLSYRWTKDGATIDGETGPVLAIGYALPRDSGEYAVSITDANGTVDSLPATLVVEPFVSIRRGNVNAAAGATTDVLFVNGSAGDEDDRTMEIGVVQPLEVRLASPPSMPAGTAHFAMYAWMGSPSKETRELLPGGIGWIAMPTPTSGRSPQPDRRANNLGAPFGTENWPARFRPTSPPPTLLFRTSRGLRAPVTWTIQGIVQDRAAPNGALAVTNGIVLFVR
jgi:hypothetical protein